MGAKRAVAFAVSAKEFAIFIRPAFVHFNLSVGCKLLDRGKWNEICKFDKNKSKDFKDVPS